MDGTVTAADVSEVIGVPDVQICRRAATAIVEADRRAVFEIVEELVSEGRDLKHFVTLLMHYLRDLTVVRAAPDRPDLLEWPQEQERLAEFAGRFSEEDLLRSLDVLTKIEEGLRWSPEPRFHLEMALLRLVEMPRLAAFDRLLEQLDQPGAPAPGPGGTSSPPAKPRLPDPPPPTPDAAESAGAGGRLLDLDPPPIIKEYQETFGGTIVSAKALPGEPPPQSEP